MKLSVYCSLLLALNFDSTLACTNANSCVNQFKFNVLSACIKDLKCQCQSYTNLVETCFTGCTRKEDLDFKDSVQSEVNSVCNGKDSDSDKDKDKSNGKDKNKHKNKDNDKDDNKDDDKDSKGTPTTINDKDKENDVTRTADDNNNGFGSATLIIDNGPTGIAIPIQGDPKRQGSVTISLSNTPIAISNAYRHAHIYTGVSFALLAAVYSYIL